MNIFQAKGQKTQLLFIKQKASFRKIRSISYFSFANTDKHPICVPHELKQQMFELFHNPLPLALITEFRLVISKVWMPKVRLRLKNSL